MVNQSRFPLILQCFVGGERNAGIPSKQVNQASFLLTLQCRAGGKRNPKTSGATSAVTALVSSRVLLPSTP